MKSMGRGKAGAGGNVPVPGGSGSVPSGNSAPGPMPGRNGPGTVIGRSGTGPGRCGPGLGPGGSGDSVKVNPGSRVINLNAVCSVCSGPSAAHTHYGAICCYSCRAFFRRGIHRNYQCVQGNGGCQVNSINRTNCKKCRYDRCLEVGMNPTLVDASLKKKSNLTIQSFGPAGHFLFQNQNMITMDGGGAGTVEHDDHMNNLADPYHLINQLTQNGDQLLNHFQPNGEQVLEEYQFQVGSKAPERMEAGQIEPGGSQEINMIEDEEETVSAEQLLQQQLDECETQEMAQFLQIDPKFIDHIVGMDPKEANSDEGQSIIEEISIGHQDKAKNSDNNDDSGICIEDHGSLDGIENGMNGYMLYSGDGQTIQPIAFSSTQNNDQPIIVNPPMNPHDSNKTSAANDSDEPIIVHPQIHNQPIRNKDTTEDNDEPILVHPKLFQPITSNDCNSSIIFHPVKDQPITNKNVPGNNCKESIMGLPQMYQPITNQDVNDFSDLITLHPKVGGPIAAEEGSGSSQHQQPIILQQSDILRPIGALDSTARPVNLPQVDLSIIVEQEDAAQHQGCSSNPIHVEGLEESILSSSPLTPEEEHLLGINSFIQTKQTPEKEKKKDSVTGQPNIFAGDETIQVFPDTEDRPYIFPDIVAASPDQNVRYAKEVTGTENNDEVIIEDNQKGPETKDAEDGGNSDSDHDIIYVEPDNSSPEIIDIDDLVDQEFDEVLKEQKEKGRIESRRGISNVWFPQNRAMQNFASMNNRSIEGFRGGGGHPKTTVTTLQRRDQRISGPPLPTFIPKLYRVRNQAQVPMTFSRYVTPPTTHHLFPTPSAGSQRPPPPPLYPFPSSSSSYRPPPPLTRGPRAPTMMPQRVTPLILQQRQPPQTTSSMTSQKRPKTCNGRSKREA